MAAIGYPKSTISLYGGLGVGQTVISVDSSDTLAVYFQCGSYYFCAATDSSGSAVGGFTSTSNITIDSSMGSYDYVSQSTSGQRGVLSTATRYLGPGSNYKTNGSLSIHTNIVYTGIQYNKYALITANGSYYCWVSTSNLGSPWLKLSYNGNSPTGTAPSNVPEAAWAHPATTPYSFTISSNQLTLSGYTFLGWSTSSTASSAAYSPGGSISISSNTTLYAVWQKQAYTVSFSISYDDGADSSGNTAPKSSNITGTFTTQSYSIGTTNNSYSWSATLHSAPVDVTGYFEFAGWDVYYNSITPSNLPAGSKLTMSANSSAPTQSATAVATWKRVKWDIGYYISLQGVSYDGAVTTPIVEKIGHSKSSDSLDYTFPTPQNVTVNNIQYKFIRWERYSGGDVIDTANGGAKKSFLANVNYPTYTWVAKWSIGYPASGKGIFSHGMNESFTVTVTGTVWDTTKGVESIAASEVQLSLNDIGQYTFDGWTDGTNTYAKGSPIDIPISTESGGVTTYFTSVLKQVRYDIGYELHLFDGSTEIKNTSFPKTVVISNVYSPDGYPSQLISSDVILPSLSDKTTAGYDWYHTGWSGPDTGDLAIGAVFSGTALSKEQNNGKYPVYNLSALWQRYYNVGFIITFNKGDWYPDDADLKIGSSSVWEYITTKSKEKPSELDPITILLPSPTPNNDTYRFGRWECLGVTYEAGEEISFKQEEIDANGKYPTYEIKALWQRHLYCTVQFQFGAEAVGLAASVLGNLQNWPTNYTHEIWSYYQYSESNVSTYITAGLPSCDNFTFNGWAETSTATTGAIQSYYVKNLTYNTSKGYNIDYLYGVWIEKTYGPFYIQFVSPGYINFASAYTMSTTYPAWIGHNGNTMDEAYYSISSASDRYGVKIDGLGYTSFASTDDIYTTFNFSVNPQYLKQSTAETYLGNASDNVIGYSRHETIQLKFKISELISNNSRQIKLLYWYSPQLMGIKLRDYYRNKLGANNTEYYLYPSSYDGNYGSNSDYLPLDDSAGVVKAIYIAPPQVSSNTYDIETGKKNFEFEGWSLNTGASSANGNTIWYATTSKTINVTTAELGDNYVERNVVYYEAGYRLQTYWIKAIYDLAGGSFTDSNKYPNEELFYAKGYNINKENVTVTLPPTAARPVWTNDDKTFDHWLQGTTQRQAGESFDVTSSSTDQSNPTEVTFVAVYWYNYYGEIIFMSVKTLEDGSDSLNLLYRKYDKNNPLRAATQDGCDVKLTKEEVEQYSLKVKDAPYYKFVGWHKNDNDKNNYQYDTVGDNYPIICSFKWSSSNITSNYFVLWAAFRQMHQYKATLSFDTNGGTGTFADINTPIYFWDEIITPSQPTKLTIKDIPVTQYNNPKKKGYQCLDWSKTKDNESTRINNAQTLDLLIPSMAYQGDNEVLHITQTLYALYKPITWTLNVIYKANTNDKTGTIVSGTLPETQKFSYTYDTNATGNEGLQEDGYKYKFKVTIPDLEPKCTNEDWFFLEWNTTADANKETGKTYLPKREYEIEGYGDFAYSGRPKSADYILYAIWVEGTICWIYTDTGGWVKAIPWIYDGGWQKSQSKLFETYKGEQTWR